MLELPVTVQCYEFFQHLLIV